MRIEVKDLALFDPLRRESKVERCGVMLGQIMGDQHVVVTRFAEVRNVHRNPSEHFRIVRSDVVRVMNRSMYAPLGYWHTHLAHHSAAPSNDDQAQMAGYPRHIGMVFHPSSSTATWFTYNIIIKTEFI